MSLSPEDNINIEKKPNLNIPLKKAGPRIILIKLKQLIFSSRTY